jgi:hypothetical protein
MLLDNSELYWFAAPRAGIIHIDVTAFRIGVNLTELRHLARTNSSQFTFGGDIIVPFTFQTMACFLNISMARRVAGSSIADSGI